MVFEKESFAINGAMFEVHRQLGPGLAEKVYQEALEIELKLRNIPFERIDQYDYLMNHKCCLQCF